MANYPSTQNTDDNLYVAVNNLSTVLTDDPLTAGATTVNVSDTTNFPSVGIITIDLEAIAYTGTTATSFTGCTRGFDGTTAASHLVNATVFHDIPAAHHNVLKEEIKAISDDLRDAFTADLDDSVSPATTATDLKERLDHLVTQLKDIIDGSDWKTSPATTLSVIDSVKNALDDADTPASTASDIKDRLDQVVSQIKLITGGANWYTAPAKDLTELLPLSGGTMSGAIAMGTNKITGVGDGTAAQDVAAFGQLKVLQVVQGTSTTIFSTTSSTFQSTNLSATITPSSTSSKILIIASASASTANGSLSEFAVGLARGTTDLTTAVGGNSGIIAAASTLQAPTCMVYLDSPSTTSATTYRTRIRNTGGGVNVTYGRTNGQQTIILMEINGA